MKVPLELLETLRSESFKAYESVNKAYESVQECTKEMDIVKAKLTKAISAKDEAERKFVIALNSWSSDLDIDEVTAQYLGIKKL